MYAAEFISEKKKGSKSSFAVQRQQTHITHEPETQVHKATQHTGSPSGFFNMQSTRSEVNSLASVYLDSGQRQAHVSEADCSKKKRRKKYSALIAKHFLGFLLYLSSRSPKNILCFPLLKQTLSLFSAIAEIHLLFILAYLLSPLPLNILFFSQLSLSRKEFTLLLGQLYL